ncbi:MAG: hypothetical protein AVDCRST_MAG91-3117, partial [uncultured Sphingomonadaceae bacterium]
ANLTRHFDQQASVAAFGRDRGDLHRVAGVGRRSEAWHLEEAARHQSRAGSGSGSGACPGSCARAGPGSRARSERSDRGRGLDREQFRCCVRACAFLGERRRPVERGAGRCGGVSLHLQSRPAVGGRSDRLPRPAGPRASSPVLRQHGRQCELDLR